MTCIETRHYATVSGGTVLVGTQTWRVGPALQRKTIYCAEASLSPEEARRAVEAIKDPEGCFRSEDGRLTVWCMEYEGDCLEWLSEDGRGIHEAFCLGSDCWSMAFVKAIEDAILEAEAV